MCHRKRDALRGYVVVVLVLGVLLGKRLEGVVLVEAVKVGTRRCPSLASKNIVNKSMQELPKHRGILQLSGKNRAPR